MGDNKDLILKVTRWLGLVSAILTFILGFVHIVDKEAKIRWPEGGFIDDTDNRGYWRVLVTLRPSVIADSWTPLIVGLIGIMAHFKDTKMNCLTRTFVHFMLFNLFKGLFADIGYAGGLGIIFSVFTWLTCLLSAVSVVMGDGDASLDLAVGGIRNPIVMSANSGTQ